MPRRRDYKTSLGRFEDKSLILAQPRRREPIGEALLLRIPKELLERIPLEAIGRGPKQFCKEDTKELKGL